MNAEERKRLREDVESWKASDIRYYEINTLELLALLDENAELRGKLGEAMEALDFYAKKMNLSFRAGSEKNPAYIYPLEDGHTARQALAKLRATPHPDGGKEGGG